VYPPKEAAIARTNITPSLAIGQCTNAVGPVDRSMLAAYTSTAFKRYHFRLGEGFALEFDFFFHCYFFNDIAATYTVGSLTVPLQRITKATLVY
jgi:hypothetical protein